MIGEGKQIDGLYVIEPSLATLVATNSKQTSSQLWHKRLGHPSDRVLEHLNLSLIHYFNKCDIYQFAKFHRLSFPEHSDKSNEIFGLIHSDIWTAPIDSKEGYRYFVTFIDDKSRATWLYLLKSKEEVFTVFQVFCNMDKNQFSIMVKVLRTDNDTEYANHKFQNFLQEKGIIHQTSCVETPQQNRVAEEKTGICWK
jgi:Integrase core domain/GAG-pre-integrase domain